MGLAYFVRVAEGDDGFDFAAVDGGLQTEPVLRLRFDMGAAGMYSASITTGARPGPVIRMSG